MVLVMRTTTVPDSLTGFLSRYLAELESGLFVGRVSRRLAERLWELATEHCGPGSVVAVLSGGSEAGYTLRVHNHPTLTVQDLDGLPMAVIRRLSGS
jgi:CRISPR-associated protein Cas2